MKKYIMIIGLLGFAFASNGQFYTGGNVSVNYDNGIYVDAAPIFGYRWDAFSAGVSPFASYSETNNLKGTYSFGNRVFCEYTIFKGIFLHGEFEILNYPYGGDRDWAIGLPVGAGYKYEIAKNTTAYGMILYDVLLDKNSPKENPVIRVGVDYNF
ncbi:MAG: hypothetical protein JXB49_12135 [Bacteroidales bacterium]|nr:hypothetical protein [Bacteroidales bacterium]